MKITRHIFVCVILLGIFSCEEQGNIPNPSGCVDLPQMHPDCSQGAITYFSEDTIQFKMPSFNPNNGNEFVYYYINYPQGKKKLIKYDILTNQKTLLVDNIQVISRLEWGKSGWIAFDSYPDYQIWMIKENGDSLKQITSSYYNLRPMWDNEGVNLYWDHDIVLASTPSYFIRINIFTNSLDTVATNRVVVSDISSNNSVVIGGTNGPAFAQNINYPLDAESMNLSGSEIGQYNDFTFINGGSEVLIASYANGFYKYQIDTKSFKKILNYCESVTYISTDYSPLNNKILVERNDYRKFITGCVENTVLKSSIYLLDLNNMQETKITLE